MIDNIHMASFLLPINRFFLNDDEGYKDGQLGKVMEVHDEVFPDLNVADLVIIGCGEERGANIANTYSNAPNEIRRELYKLYHWHKDLQIVDAGDLKEGSSLADSYAALKMIVAELMQNGKRVIVLGGSHDLTLTQYHAFGSHAKIIEATVIDAAIDLDQNSYNRSENFLMEMLTGEPNFLKHYNHIAFQSFFVHPRMLETIDKLRFDCYRVGRVKDKLEEMEPVVRGSHLFSFDVSSIQQQFMPCQTASPNGLNGEECCVLAQYVGMSEVNESFGIYGYQPHKDENLIGAKTIAQMLWYFFDGMSKRKHEAPLTQRDAYNEYHTAFAEVDTIFMQSKSSGRWWMQLPDKSFVACTLQDYQIASQNDIPERWLRHQERN